MPPGRRRERRRGRTRLRASLYALATVALVLLSPFAYRLVAVYRFDRACPDPALPGRAALIASPAPRLNRPPTRLTIASYNIYGRGALWDEDHIARVAEVIRRTSPDVIGLEEVHRGRWTSRFRDQARELARLTGMEVCFGPSFREFGGEFGNAVLTRGKIVGAGVYRLPSFGEPRSVLRCDVDFGGRRVSAFVAHLASWGGFARRERERQVECLAGLLRSAPYPFVFLGDLNARPEALELQPLLKVETVLSCGEPTATTYPSLQCRLDYILVDARWKVLDSRVLREGPSDHWPVLATLGWP